MVKSKNNQSAIFNGKETVVSNKRVISRLVNSFFGELIEKNTLCLDIFESTYLLEKNKLEIFDLRGKQLTAKELLNYLTKKKLLEHYVVYKDLREKGFVVKTALKFGFPFRVYERGKNPNKSHSKYVLLIKKDVDRIAMHELVRANRMAKTVNTTLIIAIVDSQNTVTYYTLERFLP